MFVSLAKCVFTRIKTYKYYVNVKIIHALLHIINVARISYKWIHLSINHELKFLNSSTFNKYMALGEIFKSSILAHIYNSSV